MRFFRSIFNFISIIFLFTSANVNSDSFDDALHLYQQGDFKRSFHSFNLLSRSNNAQAIFLLGKMYERGDGVVRDESKAIEFYQRSIDLGLKDGASRIEQLRNKKPSIVLNWYLESAWDGDVESKFNLGYMYENGLGVGINEATAVQWYEEAAKQHHADAQLRLGMLLVSGVGVEQNLLLAKMWFSSAGNSGNEVAKALSALLLNENNKVNSVQIIHGLRTIHHSNQEKMLRVLSYSVNKYLSEQAAGDFSFGVQTIKLLSDNSYADNFNFIDNFTFDNEGLSAEVMGNELHLTRMVIYLLLAIIFLYLIIRLFITFRSSTGSPSDNDVRMKELAYNPSPDLKGAVLTYEKRSSIIRAMEIPLVGVGSETNNIEVKNVNNDIAEVNELRLLPILGTPILEAMSLDKSVLKKSELNNNRDAYIMTDKEEKSLGNKNYIERNKTESDVTPVTRISFDVFLPKKHLDIESKSQKSNDSAVVQQEESEFNENIDAKQIARKDLSLRYIREQTREFEADSANDNESVASARLKIGLMFLKGDGVAQNVRLAIKWLERSAEMGSEKAAVELTQLIKKYPEHVDRTEHRILA